LSVSLIFVAALGFGILKLTAPSFPSPLSPDEVKHAHPVRSSSRDQSVLRLELALVNVTVTDPYNPCHVLEPDNFRIFETHRTES